MNLTIRQVLEKFNEVKVLVVGDVMLDRYCWGSVHRISPEAPVPVVNLESESLIAGGAANVAANIKGLGATPFLVGIIGNDSNGQDLIRSLSGLNISAHDLIQVGNRPTTVKTRIVAHQQQIVRLDQELKSKLSETEEQIVWVKIRDLLHLVDIVIVSDYDKGLLTENLLQRLITKCRKLKKKVLVDPKGKDYQKYQHSTILTPNKKEALEASRQNNVQEAGVELMSKIQVESLLITQGEEGMTIFEKGREPTHLGALARHVYDVTGAGDTVIATLGVALGAEADLVSAAKIANAAAGFVVEEVGTTVITINKMREVKNWV
jgi:rfaE bifunctional protein kinase chain/domain